MSDRPNRRRLLWLPLLEEEVTVLLNALNSFAMDEEQGGDPCQYVPVVDGILGRVRGLEGVALAEAEEALRQLGVGRYARRPQG